ncbi:MAG TPA: hypothetical protein VJU61_11735 [Polyangiaceae bacterium]|nr:hypothetical protein [Polyangiaceae bacterium]
MKHLDRICLGSLALPVLLALGSGCSDEAVDPDALLREATDCGGYELEPCDIVDPACRERIAEIAACQWGGPGTAPLLPEVSTLTEEEYRVSLTAQAAEATDSEQQSAFNDVLVLLGLADAQDVTVEAGVDRSAESVAAFYDFESKTITVIDHGEEMDLVVADSTLLHELIHAQQDAAHDLAGVLDESQPTTDALTSARVLFEGEAEFQQTLFEVGLQRIPIDSRSLETGLDSLRRAAQDDLFMGPSVLFSTLQFLPYTYGPEWMYRLWLNGGSSQIQSQYDKVPTNLLPVLGAAWGKPTPRALLTAFPVANVFYTGTTPAEGSELIPVGTDRLGAWTVYVAARLAGEERLAEDLALGWRGDQLDVYQLDAGGNAGRWRLNFDTDAHADAFGQRMASNPQITTRIQGKAVVCVVSQGEKPEWLFGLVTGD